MTPLHHVNSHNIVTDGQSLKKKTELELPIYC